jgi:hypothetical protein
VGLAVTDNEIREVLRGDFDLIIPNFKKWNPDTRTRRAWFALSVDWCHDPKIIKLTDADRGVWVSLLSRYAVGPTTTMGVSVVGLASAWCGDSGAARRAILKFAKLGLIILRSSALQTDKTDKTDRIEEGSLILEDLVGVENECLSLVPSSAQASWIRTYGVEAIRDVVPTAYAVWKAEQPSHPTTGVLTPLVIYLKRWLDNHKKYGSQSADAEALALRERIKIACREVRK